MAFSSFEVEFTKDGQAFDPAQIDAVETALPGLTDLIVISHGWNNNVAEARQLYDAFFARVDAILQDVPIPALNGRVFGVVRVFWPSKKFESTELIPGGGAASAAEASGDDSALLIATLERLKSNSTRLDGTDTDAARVDAMNDAQLLIPRLEADAAARSEFVDRLRSILDQTQSHQEDASAEFFEKAPETLFGEFEKPAFAPGAKAAGGGADLSDGGAAGIGDFISGIGAAARRIANFTTYYDMKTRSGDVGSRGVAKLLKRVRDAKPAIRLHLVGHSFGARLVTAAAHSLPANTKASLTLLQAAFSHNAIAQKFDGVNDGFFRAVVAESRVSGPIVITHTKNDKAVGIAYPLASRMAGDIASAVGDENDPYGGLGRNGAQHTDEVHATVKLLRAPGAAYGFQAGKVYNLQSDAFVSGHRDVANDEVVFAFLNAAAAVG